MENNLSNCLFMFNFPVTRAAVNPQGNAASSSATTEPEVTIQVKQTQAWA